MVIKVTKEVDLFIQSTGNREEDFYWFDTYFKKVGDCLFEPVV
jgi:hypothetical protein